MGATVIGTVAASGILSGCAPTPTATPAPKATEAPKQPEAKAQPTAAPTAAAAAGACQKDWNTRMPPVPKKYDPPLKIEIEFERFPEYPQGDGPTNQPLYNWIKANMGIEYTVHWAADRDTPVFTQKRKADIAGGSLADRLGTGGAELADLIKNEAVEDIKAIFEATASPLVKEKRKYPSGSNWVCVARGDKIYGIPFQWGGDGNTESVGWIRKDWLDKAGLPIPQTIEDIDKTLRTWKSKGICKYGLNAANDPFTWNHRLDVFFGAYGHMPRTWRDLGDGKLVYDSLNPENKKALALLAGWYKDGLMHPDFHTYAPWDANKVFTGGDTGITYCPWWMAGTMRDLEATTQGAQVINFPRPTGPAGRHMMGDVLVGNAIVYRKGLDKTKIEASINELNWYTELTVNGPEKYDAYSSGLFLEKYDWEWDDKCELKAGKYGTSTLNRSIGWNFDYIAYPDSIKDGNAPLLKWAKQDPKTLNKAQRFLTSDRKTMSGLESFQIVFDTKGEGILNQWIGVPTDRMVKMSPDMPNEAQMEIGIITGTTGMDAWDKWVEQWKKSGGDAFTEDINAWYATVKK